MIFFPNSRTNILGSIINNNNVTTHVYGDGIYCFEAPNVCITNCTIYGNNDVGIWMDTNSCYVTNCIVWNHYYPNTDIYGDGIEYNKITYNCIEDTAFNGIYNNISSNPQFKSAGTGTLELKTIRLALMQAMMVLPGSIY